MEEVSEEKHIKPKRVIQKTRPDWKNPKEYEYLKTADEEQFAWEFLRRSEAYRNDYNKYKKFPSVKEIQSDEVFRKHKGLLKTYFKCDPPCRKNESYDEYEQRMIAEGYSIANGEVHIVSKRVTFFRKYDLKPRSSMRRYRMRDQQGPGFSFLNEKYPMFVCRDEMGIANEMNETFSDQIVVKLCVLLPIDEQLEAVKQEMLNRAKALGKKAFKERGISDSARANYISCLRILDAINKNITDKYEYLFHIYKYVLDNPLKINDLDKVREAYAKLDPVTQKSVMKRISDDIKLADDLCNKGGYISIVKSRSHYINQSERKSKNRIEKEI